MLRADGARRAAILPLVAACAACGAAARPSGDREWIANAHGAVEQLRGDVVVAAGVDPRLALRDDAHLYVALVVFEDFGGCRHMVGALGAVPSRLERASRQLDLACDSLQRAATLFTRAVAGTDARVLGAAVRTAQHALPPLDRAELALRRE